METQILELDGPAIEANSAALSRILIDSVADGAAISFMAPVSAHEAARFWLETVRPEVEAGRRTVFGARRDGALIGTVQLLTAMPPNQPHRCEIAKMIVHPQARRLGTGRALMTRVLEHARALGKTLVTLDTRTGDVAEPLYASVGFEIAGTIPDYAFDPDGRARHATTYMYRRLEEGASA
ncbi:GNAT family N-acetyltransferase [Stappia sp. TSB10GB4]|uniref:GNAT family N-acetyltransferase n=1 Tax=Stappia sp. TSB10GB4 TaxID=2003584 RepID=UPI001648C8FA|nr:GNAT family N-acetyltransferase [Stappia sp. TSB10GB4]